MCFIITHRESINADGKRQNQDVPSRAKSCHRESDENKDEKPNDLPQNVATCRHDFAIWNQHKFLISP